MHTVRKKTEARMNVVAIDPGSEQSAVVVTDGTRIHFKLLAPNFQVIEWLRGAGADHLPCAIERPVPGGGGVTKKGVSFGSSPQILVTCYWMGRFTEAYGPAYVQHVTRGKVTHHLLGHGFKKQKQGTDTLIRAALIKRFGGDEATAKGNVKQKGPLHGFSNDLYAALALALTFLEA
jgi:hypothetical protein